MTPADPRHGTTAGYHAGCRETCCKRAIARYEKAGRLARLNGGLSVPAIGAQRRLQALMRLGWSSHAIARHAGLRHRNHVWRIINGQKGKPTVWIQRSTDKWVREVYDRLSMTVPQGHYTGRTRTHAERMGWPPPLAWDDIDNDPEPRGIRDRERRDLLTEWAELQEAGESIDQAARRLGVTVGAIEKARERASGRCA